MKKSGAWMRPFLIPVGSQTELRSEGVLCQAHKEHQSWQLDWTPRTGSAWPACGSTWNHRAGSSTSGWVPKSPRTNFPQWCLHNLGKINITRVTPSSNQKSGLGSSKYDSMCSVFICYYPVTLLTRAEMNVYVCLESLNLPLWSTFVQEKGCLPKISPINLSLF